MATDVRAANRGPGTIYAFLDSQVGRDILRRELVEGALVQPGEQALLLCDAQAPEGTAEMVRVVGAMLRELGLQVISIQVDQVLPLRQGGLAGSFAHVDHHRLPPALYAAIQAADVIFDYSASGRGAGKYNVDFYTLATYHGKRIYGRRLVEGPEALWSENDPAGINTAALLFPSDLLRVIADRVNDTLVAAAEAGAEFRLTNPWGTDLRYHTLPGDICIPGGGIREYPREERFRGDDSYRLYRALAGCTLTQRCEGVWVTRYCTLLGGELPEPMTVEWQDGFVVGARGGEGAAKLMAIVRDEPAGIHAILMGLHPKAAPFRQGRYMLQNTGVAAGTAHLGVGGPGLFYRNGAWGGVGRNHFQVGNLPRISLWAGAERVVDDGRLLALGDPAVREAARQYGDPDALLRQFEWPEAPL
ncbi:MAG TPA: hypothetical protein VII06_21770 [Chloroflexota bacterium]|jgi:hypothetical protein